MVSGGGHYTFEGETTRRIDDLVSRLEALSVRLETKYVRFDLFEASKQLAEAERAQINQRLEKMESRSEWLLRLVGGMIVTAVLGLVITAARAKTGI